MPLKINNIEVSALERGSEGTSYTPSLVITAEAPIQPKSTATAVPPTENELTPGTDLIISEEDITDTAQFEGPLFQS